MPSWEEIQEHMRGNYHLEDDAPDFMSMVWTYEDGRSQKISGACLACRHRNALERTSLDRTISRDGTCQISTGRHLALKIRKEKLIPSGVVRQVESLRVFQRITGDAARKVEG